jgi:hypothetical protein
MLLFTSKLKQPGIKKRQDKRYYLTILCCLFIMSRIILDTPLRVFKIYNLEEAPRIQTTCNLITASKKFPENYLVNYIYIHKEYTYIFI